MMKSTSCNPAYFLKLYLPNSSFFVFALLSRLSNSPTSLGGTFTLCCRCFEFYLHLYLIVSDEVSTLPERLALLVGCVSTFNASIVCTCIDSRIQDRWLIHMTISLYVALLWHLECRKIGKVFPHLPKVQFRYYTPLHLLESQAMTMGSKYHCHVTKPHLFL